MAYIIITTNEGTVVFKKQHTEYPAGNSGIRGAALLLNDMASAVLQAVMLDAKTIARRQATCAEVRDSTQ